jgi:gamma-glutamyl-gamma-aminobutyrate hydrolase PuuD
MGEVTHDIGSFMLNPIKFKLVQFTGGADITPELYGDTSPKDLCRFDSERDEMEAKIFKAARQRGIKMVGICRGMQFLNVMAGGKMMHHINGHGACNHKITTAKEATDTFYANSYHHQMVIPPKEAYIIAWANEKLSHEYIGDEDEEMDWYGPEIEGIYIPWDKILGVQWHPEALSTEDPCCDFYVTMVRDYLELSVVSFRKKYLGDEHVARADTI